MHVVSSCPICGDNQFETELHVRDYAVTHEEFNIQSCPNCGLWLTNPQPHENDLPNYYQSASYISHQGKSRSILDRIYFLARTIMLTRKLKLIESIQSKGKLLDYGCGTGAFVARAQQRGWPACGFEPSEEARNAAHPNVNIAKNVEELHGPFDVITLWHVLEHLPKLEFKFRQITSLLAPGGLLVVAVPNHESWDAKHYKETWAAYDVPRHLWHFNPRAIARAFENLNLKQLPTQPLPLDSFFVSLLSEQYKQTPPVARYPIALWHGLFSNWKAHNTKNYSSLIYLARK